MIKGFLCPSDPNSGSGQNGDVSYGGNINNYAASFGTDTTGGNYAWDNNALPFNNQDPMGCVGMFGWAVSYGVQPCTDGTSNTIAYAEWLVGDGKGPSGSHYRGNMEMADGDGNIWALNGLTNLANIQTDLQLCATKFASEPASNAATISDYKGWRWSLGAISFASFNTVQTPNDHGRRLPGRRHKRSLGEWRLGHGGRQCPSGRMQRAVLRWQRQVRQEQHRADDLDGARHSQRRRDHQLRLVLITIEEGRGAAAAAHFRPFASGDHGVRCQPSGRRAAVLMTTAASKPESVATNNRARSRAIQIVASGYVVLSVGKAVAPINS